MSGGNTKGFWPTSACRDPLLVSLKVDAKSLIEDAKGAIAVAHYGLRHNRLYFLREYSDIGTIAPVVAEAIKAKTVVEMPEQDDVVLERDIRAPSTTSTSTAAAAAETATTAAA